MDQLISALQKAGLNFESQSASHAENVRRHVDSPRHVEKGRRKSTRSVRKSAAAKRKTKQAMPRKNVEQSSVGQRRRSVQFDVEEDVADLEQESETATGDGGAMVLICLMLRVKVIKKFRWKMCKPVLVKEPLMRQSWEAKCCFTREENYAKHYKMQMLL